MGDTDQTKPGPTAEGHLHAGIAHSRSGQHDLALDCYRSAIALDPRSGEAHYNLGHALSALGKYEKALESYDRAITLHPDVPEIRYNKGNAFVELRLFKQAISCFEQAISLRPDYREAHQNLGNTLLAAGEFDRGYDLYEWRWQGGEKSAYKNRKFSPPRWDGSSLKDKSILIWGEQGLGDEIVFASLYRELMRTGVSLIQDTVDPLVDVDGYAAQIKSLDLVISIVNSTAVLASALDVPVWGLVPHSCDWRWGNEGQMCDWYPSMRLYRGSRHDGWATAFRDITRDLEAWVKDKTSDG